MCTRFKTLSGEFMLPGKKALYSVSHDKKYGTWGMMNGRIYNARIERLYEFWKPLSSNRGILNILSFEEKGCEVSIPGSLYIPVIYNDNSEFAMLTTASQGALATIHHRSPIILFNDPSEWLDTGKIVEYIIRQSA